MRGGLLAYVFGARSTFFLKESEVELVTLLGCCSRRSLCQLLLLMIRLDYGRLIENLFVGVQEKKLITRWGNTTPMPLMRCVQNVRLLAKKSITLIRHILHYFWPSTPIFNAEGAIGSSMDCSNGWVRVDGMARASLIEELCHTLLAFGTMGRLLLLLLLLLLFIGKLLLILDGQVTRLNAMNIFITLIILLHVVL